jgi:hypothetical protein
MSAAMAVSERILVQVQVRTRALERAQEGKEGGKGGPFVCFV